MTPKWQWQNGNGMVEIRHKCGYSLSHCDVFHYYSLCWFALSRWHVLEWVSVELCHCAILSISILSVLSPYLCHCVPFDGEQSSVLRYLRNVWWVFCFDFCTVYALATLDLDRVRASSVCGHFSTYDFATRFSTNLKSGLLWNVTSSVHNEEYHFGTLTILVHDYFGTLNCDSLQNIEHKSGCTEMVLHMTGQCSPPSIPKFFCCTEVPKWSSLSAEMDITEVALALPLTPRVSNTVRMWPSKTFSVGVEGQKCY